MELNCKFNQSCVEMFSTAIILALAQMALLQVMGQMDLSDPSLGTNDGKPMWSPWYPWTPCSLTCGMGKRKRLRVCWSGDRSVDGNHCSRSSQESAHTQEVVSCSVGPCFVGKVWVFHIWCPQMFWIFINFSAFGTYLWYEIYSTDLLFLLFNDMWSLWSVDIIYESLLCALTVIVITFLNVGFLISSYSERCGYLWSSGEFFTVHSHGSKIYRRFEIQRKES